MSSIVKYLIIGTATLALSLSAACKEDSSPAAQEAAAGSEEGVKEGVKEGGTEGGKAAASEVVN